MEMNLQEYIDFIKLELTGGIIDLEIPDENIGKIINNALKEIQRYIDYTKLVTIPFSSCMDISELNCYAVINVYRPTSANTNSEMVYDSFYNQLNTFSGFNYGYNDYLTDYITYSTFKQIRNTISTDLVFKEDRENKKLYVTYNTNKPATIVIEYIPIFNDVSEIKEEFWIDVLKRMSLAMVKVALGRVRTRFKQSNALYNDDGDTILEEGKSELATIREKLVQNHNILTPTD